MMDYDPPLVLLTEKLIFLEQLIMEAEKAGDHQRVEAIKKGRRELLDNYGMEG